MHIGYVIIALVVIIFSVCSIPFVEMRFPDGERYEVIRIEWGHFGRRCTLRNILTKRTVLCEWNEFSDAEIGNIFISVGGKLKEVC